MRRPADLTFRPIRPEDGPALAAAFDRLSPTSRYRRFLGPKPELSAAELDYLTRVDHVRHEAIVAVAPDGHIVGVARYATWAGRPCVADVAFTVADEWQGKGLGTDLARRLVDAATDNGILALTGSTLWENEPSRRLLSRLGFRPAGSQDGVIEFRLDLAATRRRPRRAAGAA